MLEVTMREAKIAWRLVAIAVRYAFNEFSAVPRRAHGVVHPMRLAMPLENNEWPCGFVRLLIR